MRERIYINCLFAECERDRGSTMIRRNENGVKEREIIEIMIERERGRKIKREGSKNK